MANSALSVTVGADVTDLRTKLALAQNDVKTFSAETRKLADEMRGASDSARAQMLPQLQAAAKAAGDAKAAVASLTATTREHSGAANENSSMLSANRSAFMELEHSVRASIDALAAGADPMRVLAMEAPRAAQAITLLSSEALSAIISPAGAAAAGIALVAAGLGVLAVQAISAQHALEDAKSAMLFAGTLNDAGIKAYNDDIHNLIQNFGLGKTEATQAAEAIAALKGPATAYRDQLLNIGVEYANLKKLDLKTAMEEIVKAANGGSDSFMKWADQVGIVTQKQKDLVGSTGHDELTAFRSLIDGIASSWGGVGDKVAAANRQQKEYMAMAMAMAAGGGSPVDIGMTGPTEEDLHPSNGPQAPKPADEQANRTASAYNQVLVERTGILRDIQILETALATETDPAKRADDEQALAAARLKAVQLHSAAENAAWQEQLGHIRQEAAAAKEGSDARIAALRQEAQAIRERNTLRDEKGNVTFDGTQTQEYQQAETAIAEAVRQNQEKNRTEYEKTITTMERVIAQANAMASQMTRTSMEIAAGSIRTNDQLDRNLKSFMKNQDTASRQMARNSQQMAHAAAQPYMDAFRQAESSVNSHFKGMLLGSETLQQGLQGIAEGILGSFIDLGLKLVENWIETEIAKLIFSETISATTSTGQIASSAAIAGAGAYAATAGIPYVGPILAPAAAATAYASTMAFQGLAHFDVGSNYVPKTGLAVVHKGEVITPAEQGAPYSAAGSSGGQGRGDTHYNVDMSGSSFGAGTSQRQVEAWVIGGLQKAHRNLAFAGKR